MNKNGFRNHLKLLKCSRNRRFSQLSLTFPVDEKLKDGSPVQLVLADDQDVEPVRRLDRDIIEQLKIPETIIFTSIVNSPAAGLI